MNMTQFRKLSYAIYVADENDLVKLAGPISGLKRLLRRMLNRMFSKDSKEFKENNSELKDALQNLYSSFKDLENSIDDHDLQTYKHKLNEVKERMSRFNDVLSKARSDVARVENEAKDEIKTKLTDTTTPNENPSGTIQENAESASEATSADNSEEVSPHVGKLISDLLPQPEPQADSEPMTPAPEAEVTPVPAAEPVAPATAAEWASTQQAPFPAMALMNTYVLEVKPSNEDKIKRIVMGPGDPPNKNQAEMMFWPDFESALKQGTVEQWEASINKKKLTGYRGFIKFAMRTAYMKRSFVGKARIKFDTVAHKIIVDNVEEGTVPINASYFESREIRKFARNLGPNFWPKFNSMATRLGVQPEVLLPVMYIESAGFNPQAKNPHGGAVGLVQFMPQTLKGMGLEGHEKVIENQSGEEQLGLIEKFIKGTMGFNGGVPYKDAATYYISNFWPDSLRYRKYYEQNKGKPGWWPEGSFHDAQAGDPEAVIVEANPQYRKSPNFSPATEAGAYKSNPALDKNKDGRITLGDLQVLIEQTKKSAGYRALEAEMRNGGGYQSGSAGINPVPDEKDNGVIRYLLQNLDMEGVPANNNFFSSIMQAIPSAAALKTDMIEVFGKDKHVNGEFIRVASLVLARDYGVLPDIFASGSRFQITYASNRINQEEMRLLCSEIAEELRAVVPQDTKFRFYVHKNANSSLPPLSLERAQNLARVFRITFAG